ncbi:hypothetical protein BC940DRAFT_295374 [Gongronella butleri]|nr:hypothetical protein BC940DRAFT_295374 [Gongronella butleri]
MGGEFVCCEGCPRVFHFTCMEPPMDSEDVSNLDDKWYCKVCRYELDHGKVFEKKKNASRGISSPCFFARFFDSSHCRPSASHPSRPFWISLSKRPSIWPTRTHWLLRCQKRSDLITLEVKNKNVICHRAILILFFVPLNLQ